MSDNSIKNSFSAKNVNETTIPEEQNIKKPSKKQSHKNSFPGALQSFSVNPENQNIHSKINNTAEEWSVHFNKINTESIISKPGENKTEELIKHLLQSADLGDQGTQRLLLALLPEKPPFLEGHIKAVLKIGSIIKLEFLLKRPPVIKSRL